MFESLVLEGIIDSKPSRRTGIGDPYNTSLTSAGWGRRAPAAARQTGDLLRSIQVEVFLTEVMDVKAHLVLRLLDGHHVALRHLARRLTVHLCAVRTKKFFCGWQSPT